MTKPCKFSRIISLALVMAMALPTLAMTAGCGNKGGNDTASNGGTTSGGAMNAQQQPAKTGLSGKQKVVLLAGAALLFYLYKKDMANNKAAAQGGKRQLYRSKNGGVYYRDAQKKPVWLTVPQGGMQVPADQVTPDIQQYQGQPAPPAPAGYGTQSFSDYDPSAAGPSGPGQ